ncbi:MAG: hypothetical protein WCD37_19215, partial [Chloroflexia bacterium]
MAPFEWYVKNPIDRDNFQQWVDDFNRAILEYCIHQVLSYLSKPSDYPLVDKQVAGLLETIQDIQSNLVTNREQTLSHLAELFAQDTGKIDRQQLEAGSDYLLQLQASGIALTKVKQMSLATQLFSRLPTFDNANVEELLDIRKELE